MITLLIIFIIVVVVGYLLAQWRREPAKVLPTKAPSSLRSDTEGSSKPAPLVVLDPIVPDNKPSTGTKIRWSDTKQMRVFDKNTDEYRDVTVAASV